MLFYVSSTRTSVTIRYTCPEYYCVLLDAWSKIRSKLKIFIQKAPLCVHTYTVFWISENLQKDDVCTHTQDVYM